MKQNMKTRSLEPPQRTTAETLLNKRGEERQVMTEPSTKSVRSGCGNGVANISVLNVANFSASATHSCSVPSCDSGIRSAGFFT